MTPELREHIAAFTADCAADGLGYLGRHRRDHAGTSVAQIADRLAGTRTPYFAQGVVWNAVPVPSLPVVASPPRPSTGEGKGRLVPDLGRADQPTTYT